MDLNKGNMKKIRGLILFTAVVCLAVVKLDVLLEGFFFPVEYCAAIHLWCGNRFRTEYSHEGDRKKPVFKGEKSESGESEASGKYFFGVCSGRIGHCIRYGHGSAAGD